MHDQLTLTFVGATSISSVYLWSRHPVFFDLKSNSRGVVLTITVPKEAAEAADLLFDHFAPELASSNLKEIA